MVGNRFREKRETLKKGRDACLGERSAAKKISPSYGESNHSMASASDVSFGGNTCFTGEKGERNSTEWERR